MNKRLYFILLLGIILGSISTEASTPRFEDLIKVTPSSDSKCIEYYTYKSQLYCTTTAYHPQTIDPTLKDSEKLKITFDNRPWQFGWGKKEADGTTTLEYIPMGETIDNWNELITSQFFPELQKKVTPKQFAKLFAQQFKDNGYNPIVTFWEDTPNKVIVEFRITKPKNQAQDELQMLTSDDKGIYLLHYAVKNADMGQKNRKKWVQNLKNSTIKNE